MAAVAKAAKEVADSSAAEKDEGSSSGGLGMMNFSDKGLCPDLSVTQRFGGFVLFMGVGIFFNFLALVALSMLRTTAFAFYFIVSTTSWTGSSLFIVGPKKQCQNMKQPKRRNCAITMVLCWILTLVVVVKQPFGAFFLCFFFGTAQYCTFWYYMLSYIPFGRKGARKLCDALVNRLTS